MLYVASFFNFRIIPGEIVPYPLLSINYLSKRGVFLIAIMILTLLIKLLLITSSDDFYLFLLNGLELIIVVSFIFLVKDSPRLLRSVNAAVLIFFILGLAAYYFPTINNVKSLFINRTIASDVYAAHARGIPFLSPEPSYAAVWFLGCHMYLYKYRKLAKLGFLTSLLGVIFTLSIWGYFLAFIFYGVLIARRLSFQLFVFLTFGIIFMMSMSENIVSFQTSEVRIIRVLGLAAQLLQEVNLLQAVIEIENIFGSTRLIFLIENIQTIIPFTCTDYAFANSMLAQFLSVFGSFIGIIIFLIILLFLGNGERLVHSLWIFAFLGPTLMLPAYLILLRKGQFNNG